MKHRNIISLICIIAGACCIIVALCMQVYNEYENSRAEEENREIVSAIRSMNFTTEQSAKQNNDAENIGEELIGNIDDTFYEMPITIIDGYGYIGTLFFNSIELEMPVMSEWDENRLKKAPCRYHGSLETHDLVIAGHNYRSGFSKIKQLKNGDIVMLATVNGIVHKYTVDAQDTIEPTSIDEMTESPWDLSLYTCTYDGKLRYTIRCKELITE